MKKVEIEMECVQGRAGGGENGHACVIGQVRMCVGKRKMADMCVLPCAGNAIMMQLYGRREHESRVVREGGILRRIEEYVVHSRHGIMHTHTLLAHSHTMDSSISTRWSIRTERMCFEKDKSVNTCSVRVSMSTRHLPPSNSYTDGR